MGISHETGTFITHHILIPGREGILEFKLYWYPKIYKYVFGYYKLQYLNFSINNFKL